MPDEQARASRSSIVNNTMSKERWRYYFLPRCGICDLSSSKQLPYAQARLMQAAM